MLSDDEKRQRYDRYGHAGLNGVGIHDFSGMGVDDIFSIFSDLFGGAFGGAVSHVAAATRGVDIQAVVEIELKDVLTGVEKSLRFERDGLLRTLPGPGLRARHATPPLPDLRRLRAGRAADVDGLFRDAQRRRMPALPTAAAGPPSGPARSARAAGSGRRAVTASSRFPPAYRTGRRVRLRGEGEPSSAGNQRGELPLRRAREAARVFPARGRRCDLPAADQFHAGGTGHTGGRADADRRDAAAHSGRHAARDRLSLPGKGLPNLRSGRRGNQIVQVAVEIPKKLSREQAELLRKFAATEDKSVLPDSKGFFERVKEYLTRRDRRQGHIDAIRCGK